MTLHAAASHTACNWLRLNKLRRNLGFEGFVGRALFCEVE